MSCCAMKLKTPSTNLPVSGTFNVRAFLESAGLEKTIEAYERGDAIFTQGDACEDVMYLQTGCVKLSVLSKTGKEAVVAMLGPGDFFGEGCLAGQPLRVGSATAVMTAVCSIAAHKRSSPNTRV